jgi:endonuclease YncB( thermonuclease family)
MVARGWPPRRRSPAEERLFRLKWAFRRVSNRARAAPRYSLVALAGLAALAGFAGVWTWASAVQQPTKVISAGAIIPSRILVLDGDTIRIDGRKPDVRLVGLNAPETSRAECKGERDLGEAATRRLQQIVNGSALDLRYVACNCPPGTEGTERCNYGRRCGVLKANGRDVASILIAEKLAVPFHCSGTSCPPTPRPWCRG